MFDCSLDFSTLSLTANDLFAEMGYGNTAPEEPVEALALSMLKEVSSRTVPRCTFGLFDGTVDDGYVTLDGGEPFLVGGTIASLLKGSERFARDGFSGISGQPESGGRYPEMLHCRYYRDLHCRESRRSDGTPA